MSVWFQINGKMVRSSGAPKKWSGAAHLLDARAAGVQWGAAGDYRADGEREDSALGGQFFYGRRNFYLLFITFLNVYLISIQ